MDPRGDEEPSTEISAEVINPDYVLKLDKPTKGFLCTLSDNVYGIEFTEFAIKDYDTGRSLFNVKKDCDAVAAPPPVDLDPEYEASLRTIQYSFPSDFLKFKTIRTLLSFSVGPNGAQNFRMIERHYLRDKLLRGYDFTFGYCIPNSINTWEAIYELPKLEPDLIQDIKASPFEVKSDSFYFVGDRLIMHNKAEYAYDVD